MMFALNCLIFLWVSIRLFCLKGCTFRPWKGFALLLIAVGVFKFNWIHLLGGPMYFAPNLPGWLIALTSWWYGVFYFLFPLLVAFDSLRLVLAWLRLLPGCTFRQRLFWKNERSFLLLFVVALLLGSIAFYGGLKEPIVREVEVAIQNLPPSAEGMRVAVLTDLHVDRLTSKRKLVSIIQRTNALHPDVICLLGDLVDGLPSTCAAHLSLLSTLSAKYGVYGVPGNHEYYSDFSLWRGRYAQWGIRLLCNRNDHLANGVTIAGVEDRIGARYGDSGMNLEEAFQGIAPNEAVVFLSHRPDCARLAEECGASLQLSGHTHGGMIWGMDYLVALLNGGFVSGRYQVGRMTLYVSNGTSIWSGFPLRLGAPSEITLIRLTRK